MENKISDEIKWNINITTEREYWYNHLLKTFIKVPFECPNCKKNVKEKENNSFNNPIVYKCSKCGKIIYLRQYNFYSLFPRTTASAIHNIVKMWLIGEQNATKIYKAISNNYTFHVSDEQTIINILIKLRQTIGHFLKDK